nr:putative mediator of RNA polymerase II transcription subunit 24 [Ipomoea batatas]
MPPRRNQDAREEALGEKFYPEHVRAAKYDEFFHLRQGNHTVQEYYTDFINLARFAPVLVPDERSKVGKFIRGLNFETQKSLSMFRCQTLDEAYDRAASHCLAQQRQRRI